MERKRKSEMVEGEDSALEAHCAEGNTVAAGIGSKRLKVQEEELSIMDVEMESLLVGSDAPSREDGQDCEMAGYGPHPSTVTVRSRPETYSNASKPSANTLAKARALRQIASVWEARSMIC